MMSGILELMAPRDTAGQLRWRVADKRSTRQGRLLFFYISMAWSAAPVLDAATVICTEK